MVANYSTKGDSLFVDKPRVWYEGRIANRAFSGSEYYDAAPDGKRIFALMPGGSQEDAQASQRHVILLENFADELRRKVALK
jgi:hypothetical protein